MSEITVETGELPVCVNCQLKHAVGLLHHVDPEWEKEKYSKTLGLINEIGEGLMMTSQEVEDFIRAYKLEHKIEDALTVLRDLRHNIMEGSEKRFEALEEVEREMNNPGSPEIPERCEFAKEPVKPKEYFDPDSFRTICPECPEARCSICPPELACATRIITGCKEGEFVKGRCQVGTEAHVIYHGKSKHSSSGDGSEVYVRAGTLVSPLDLPWSAKIKCPKCGHIDLLSEFALNAEILCPSCGARIPSTVKVEVAEDIPLYWEPGGSSGSNPGNPDEGYPDKVERWKRRRGLVKVAEDLSDNDAVVDALFDLRGEILQALTKMGEVAPETTGPEVQGTIDYLIRRLVFLA